METGNVETPRITFQEAYSKGYEFFDRFTTTEGIEAAHLGPKHNPYLPSGSNGILSAGIAVRIIDDNAGRPTKLEAKINDWIIGYNTRYLEVVPYEDRYPYFSKRIRSERDRLGWTRDGMANKGGVTRAGQMLYDSGNLIPPLSYFVNLGLNGADLQMLLFGERFERQPDNISTLTEEQYLKAIQVFWNVSKNTNRELTDDNNTRHVIDVITKNAVRLDGLSLPPTKKPGRPLIDKRSFIYLALGAVIAYLLFL